MNAPRITFPGIESILSCQYDRTHGVSPGVAVLEIAPQPGYEIATSGTLTVEYDGQTMVLRDCLVDSASFRRTPSGEVWRVSIFDRRWKWRWGSLWGRYNLRNDDGTFVGDKTDYPSERTPAELAALCLEAMGEEGFDVAGMPELIRPEIEWDFLKPAECLASLCDMCRCFIVLGWNDRVRVVQAGIGELLPILPGMLESAATNDPPEMPSGIAIITAPVRFQVDLELEAVALDMDEEVRLIDDVRYTPRAAMHPSTVTTDTWRGMYPEPAWDCLRGLAAYDWISDQQQTTDDEVIKDVLDRANKTVYKWYRVKLPTEQDPLTIPGWTEPIIDIEDILPLEDQLCEVDAQDRNLPAKVYGLWYDDKNGNYNNGFEVDLDPAALKPSFVYPGSFRVNGAKGIIEFAERVYRNAAAPTSLNAVGQTDVEVDVAKLWIRTSVCVRQTGTRTRIRYVKWRGDGQDRCRGEKREELQLFYIARYDKAHKITDEETNKDLIDPDCDKVIDVLTAEYQSQAPSEASYPGLVAIEPDGAIQQVRVSVDKTGIRTHASRGGEIPGTLEYQERRAIERERADTLKLATEETTRRNRRRSGGP